MENKDKIAVFGGTFDPPTKAHQKIINYLSDEFKSVMVLPVFIAPLKSGVVSFEHRLKMVQMITEENSNVFVSDIEREILHNNRTGKNYTYKTMETLRNLEPEETFVFVHGPDIELKKYQYGELIGESFLIPKEYMNRSSEFRKNIREKNYEKAKTEVPKEIWNYIKKTKIYDPNVSVDIQHKTNSYLPLLDLEINYNETNSFSDEPNESTKYFRNLIAPKDSIGVTLYDPIKKKVLIKREKRYGPFLNEGKLFSYGVVEGTIEKNEDPVECAIREIEEETGLIVKKENIIHINSWYPSAGYMTEKKHVLLALFDSDHFNENKNKHGLKEENEEIFTELFDLRDIILFHTTEHSNIFSPEISSSLLYIQNNNLILK